MRAGIAGELTVFTTYIVNSVTGTVEESVVSDVTTAMVKSIVKVGTLVVDTPQTQGDTKSEALKPIAPPKSRGEQKNVSQPKRDTTSHKHQQNDSKTSDAVRTKRDAVPIVQTDTVASPSHKDDRQTLLPQTGSVQSNYLLATAMLLISGGLIVAGKKKENEDLL